MIYYATGLLGVGVAMNKVFRVWLSASSGEYAIYNDGIFGGGKVTSPGFYGNLQLEAALNMIRSHNERPLSVIPITGPFANGHDGYVFWVVTEPRLPEVPPFEPSTDDE